MEFLVYLAFFAVLLLAYGVSMALIEAVEDAARDKPDDTDVV